MKKYSRLIFLFTAVITVVCQCSLRDSPQTLAGHECKFSGSVDADNGDYEGTFTCKNPDGSNLICPYTNQPVSYSTISGRIVKAKQMTDAQFWSALGCVPTSQSTATPRPTATATPVPTATHTATAPAAAAGSVQGVSAPLLTGDVTACNVNDGFINFKLVEGMPPFSGDQVVVEMNGTQVNCVVPSNNTSVLSCGLPAGVTYPVQVSVAQGGNTANQFSYNGAACLYTEPPQGEEDSGDDDASSTESAPTACTGDC